MRIFLLNKNYNGNNTLRWLQLRKKSFKVIKKTEITIVKEIRKTIYNL